MLLGSYLNKRNFFSDNLVKFTIYSLELIYTKGYQTFDSITSVVTTKVKGNLDNLSN